MKKVALSMQNIDRTIVVKKVEKDNQESENV